MSEKSIELLKTTHKKYFLVLYGDDGDPTVMTYSSLVCLKNFSSILTREGFYNFEIFEGNALILRLGE